MHCSEWMLTQTVRLKRACMACLTLNVTHNSVVCFNKKRGTWLQLGNQFLLMSSKMPTVRNARSLVTSRELPSGLQIWGKSPLNALFTVDADTDSASEESVKVIQGRVAHGTLYVRLTCPTKDNRHNKLSQVPEF